MKREKLEIWQKWLEKITKKWWFFLIFILLQFLPPFASKSFEYSEIGVIIGQTLSFCIAYSLELIFPLFKIIPILLIICIIFFQNKATRFFNFYVGFSYVLFAFLQSIAITEQYGLSIVLNNLIMFNIIAAFWFWETFAKKNDFTLQKQPIWKYWVVPLAFLAFWYPLNQNILMPDFNPIYLLTNPAGLTFCMMTPVYLSILILYYPKVNIITLRVTSLAGVIIGFYNVWLSFLIMVDVFWWNGVLHLPLTIISLYGLIISFKKIDKIE